MENYTPTERTVCFTVNRIREREREKGGEEERTSEGGRNNEKSAVGKA